jgi:hypothetical protein
MSNYLVLTDKVLAHYSCCLFVGSTLQGKMPCDFLIHLEMGQNFGIPTYILGLCPVQTFSRELKDTLVGLHHANDHVFPI